MNARNMDIELILVTPQKEMKLERKLPSSQRIHK